MQVQAQYKPVLSWLKWNSSGRSAPFRSRLARNVELDTTTLCRGLPSCSENCSFAHSRGFNYVMGLPLADKILTGAYDQGFRSVLFSGGGEPLDPRNINFNKILLMAHQKGFACSLVTNGLFLDETKASEILPFLTSVRISVPAIFKGYDHLSRLLPTLGQVINMRDTRFRDAGITASVLLRPDTPIEEVVDKVRVLDGIGIDKIRLKPAHMRRADGKFEVDIQSFRQVVEHFQHAPHPKVVLSKMDSLLQNPDTGYQYCYYSDFNPFSIGADGNAYRCCEKKYDPRFLSGDFNTENAGEILMNASRAAFGIRPECFVGCKGHLANTFLSKLVEGYAAHGDSLFDLEQYRQIADQVLIYIGRQNPKA